MQQSGMAGKMNFVMPLSYKEKKCMNNYNRKFSVRLKRFERWLNISDSLSALLNITAPFDGASPNDVQAVREIHRLIQKCRIVAGDRLKEARINDRVLR